MTESEKLDYFVITVTLKRHLDSLSGITASSALKELQDAILIHVLPFICLSVIQY